MSNAYLPYQDRYVVVMAVMMYTLNGTGPERVGNRHKDRLPHSVFHCNGEENWVATSVEDHPQFQ